MIDAQSHALKVKQLSDATHLTALNPGLELYLATLPYLLVLYSDLHVWVILMNLCFLAHVFCSPMQHVLGLDERGVGNPKVCFEFRDGRAFLLKSVPYAAFR